MTDPRIAAFQREVGNVLQHLKTEFSRLQTGRANAALVEHLQIEAYGAKQDLRSIAGISVEQRTIVVQPWDRSILGNIERAMSQADIGASPVNDGVVLRITLPPLTEERRAQLRKTVQKLAEDARISIRKHRQTAHDAIKPEKDEDVRETLMKILQKEVEDANTKIGTLAKNKEEEVMKV